MPPDLSYGATEPAPRCTEHGGAHARHLGHCYAVGAQVPRPILYSRGTWDCACGRRVYGAIERKTMRRWLIDEETGEEHRCPPAIRVEMDEERLAEGIAGALHGLMRQRASQRATRPASVAPEPRRAQQQPPDPDGALAAVTVWTSDDRDDVS